MKGIYLLVIKNPQKQDILVGSLGRIHFERGCYVYIGSALGGFKSRLNRHKRKEKVPKWHVDYLLQKASLESIIVCETDERVECAVAGAVEKHFSSVPRFGSSDCKCASHLFHPAGENGIKEEILAILASLSLKGRVVE